MGSNTAGWFVARIVARGPRIVKTPDSIVWNPILVAPPGQEPKREREVATRKTGNRNSCPYRLVFVGAGLAPALDLRHRQHGQPRGLPLRFGLCRGRACPCPQSGTLNCVRFTCNLRHRKTGNRKGCPYGLVCVGAGLAPALDLRHRQHGQPQELPLQVGLCRGRACPCPQSGTLNCVRFTCNLRHRKTGNRKGCPYGLVCVGAGLAPALDLRHRQHGQPSG